MLSKKQAGYVRSLHLKKFRQMYGKFIVEGEKLVRELLHTDLTVDTIFSTVQVSETKHLTEIIEVTEAELGKIATQQQPDKMLAVVSIPTPPPPGPLGKNLYLALDDINDPGNAGTIIRIADWFGVQQVFLSPATVDIYNPKTVAAAKGSLFRVPCAYTNLAELIAANPGFPVLGTFMQGDNIYNTPLPNHGLIIIGNEANGISPQIAQLVTQKLTIPAFGKAESLNAGVATGIVLSEFRRQLSAPTGS